MPQCIGRDKRSPRVSGQRRKKKEKFEEEGSKEDGDKAPAAKRRKVPKSQYNVLSLHLHEDILPLWLR